MALPNILPANQYQMFIGTGLTAPNDWAFLCIASEKSLQEAMNFEEVYLPDCANPDGIPNRTSRPTGKRWEISAPSYLDPNNAAFQALRTKFDALATVPVKIVEKVTGGKTKTGTAWVEECSTQGAGAGLMKVTVKLRGEGILVATDTVIA